MANFFDATMESVESSIKIVDDDDSIKPVGSLGQLRFRSSLSIMW